MTEACQLRCRYCRPAHAVLPPPGTTAPWPVWYRRISALSKVVPLEKIRFTGGEPLLYSDIVPLIEACAADTLPGLAMTTNAFLLKPRVGDLKQAGLTRVNISLDALDPDRFLSMTGARPHSVIEAIDACLEADLIVKLNAVILKGINDTELAPLIRFASERQITIRFLEMMPIGAAADEFKQRYLSGRDMMNHLIDEGFDFQELPYLRGETSRDFHVTLPEGRSAVCGFILPTSTPFCRGCRRLRITSDGLLMGCLAQPDVLEFERAVHAVMDHDNSQPMLDLIQKAFAIKHRTQQFEQQREMIRIGG